MAKNPDLDIFIKDSVKAGKKLDEIKSILFQAGWDEKHVNDSLGYFYPAEYPVAVPYPKTFASPRLFFLNLFSFLLLYLLAYNVVAILFSMLDHYLPDGLGQYKTGAFYEESVKDAIHGYLAVILVAVPMLYITHRILTKAMQMTKQAIPRIRLMLIYLTLFAGACIILCNACLFVSYFLKGELSLRFVIKISILSVIVIGFYMYYRGALKQDEQNA